MIPDLPDLYVDHLVQPRGQEDLARAEAVGERGSMVGGMGVRVTLTWRQGHDGEAVVRAAGARVFGSPAALAPASCLSEHVVGLTPEAAAAIGAEDLLAALAGPRGHDWPTSVQRGAEIAIGALHCALGLPGCRPADPEGGGILVCRCLSVGDRVIHGAIAAGADSPEAVGELCRAGSGCRSCRSDLLVLLQQDRGPHVPPPPRDLPPLARVLWSRVAPLLAAHGLPLRDVRVTEDDVRLRLADPAPAAQISPRGAVGLTRQVLEDVVGEGVPVLLL